MGDIQVKLPEKEFRRGWRHWVGEVWEGLGEGSRKPG